MSSPSLPPPGPSLKIRALRWLFLGLAATAAATFLLYGIENVRGWYAWKTQRDQFLALGRKLQVSAFVPPPIPDDRNFAAIPELKPLFEFDPSPLATNRWKNPEAYRRAMALLTFPVVDGVSTDPDVPVGNGNWTRGEPIDLAAFQTAFRNPKKRDPRTVLQQRYGIAAGTNLATTPAPAPSSGPRLSMPPSPGSPAADTLAALRVFDADFKIVEAGLRRGECRFAVQYADGYATLLPHLAMMKKFGLRFRLRAVARLAEGDVPGAMADLESLILVAESIRNEPFLISQLVRAACHQYVLQVVWEGTTRHAWNDPQLAAISDRLAKVDLLGGFRASLHAERSQLVNLIDHLVASGEERMKYVELVRGMSHEDGDAEARARTLKLYLAFAPRGWLYANLAASSRVLESLAAFDPARVATLHDDWQSALDAEPASIRLFLHHRYFFENGIGLRLDGSVVTGIRTHHALRLALTAMALERQRLALGIYPPTLDQLEGRFQTTALDLAKPGQPFHYRLESKDRFRLWNEGSDGRNDDGAWPAPTGDSGANTQTGDWVWGWPTARE